MIGLFRRKRHRADEYFKAKFREPLSEEGHRIVFEARAIRHHYPDLSGPELVCLVYWGSSGERIS